MLISTYAKFFWHYLQHFLSLFKGSKYFYTAEFMLWYLIRKEQLDRFSVYVLDQFKVRLKEHMVVFFPFQTSFAGEVALERFIAIGIEQAQSFGFETEATVQSFTDHMILLGLDFCHNPLYTAITAPLFDAEIEDPIQRHDLLYDRAWAYLDDTRGPDATNLFRAAARLRAWLAGQKSPTSRDIPDLMQTLKTIYPEKCAAHPDGTLSLFCTAALQRARMDNFTEPSAQVLYVAIALLTGLGFFGDPLVVGAIPDQARALEKETAVAERTRLLIEGAEMYLGRVIVAARSANMAGME